MPITATRLPVRSTEWSQRAEWKSAPSKVSMPSISGSRGSDRPPARGDQGPRDHVAGRRTAAPALGRRRPRPRARARCGTTCASVTPYSRATLRRYCLDLGLRGVRRRPVGVAREGERVELAGDVAAGAGVGVVAPGAADVVALLDHEVVGLAVLGQPDRRAEPGEPGPDDQVVDVRGQGRCGHGVTLARSPTVRGWPWPGSPRRFGGGRPLSATRTSGTIRPSAGGQVVDGDAVDGLGGEGVARPRC